MDFAKQKTEGACERLRLDQISRARALPQSLRDSSLPEGAFGLCEHGALKWDEAWQKDSLRRNGAARNINKFHLPPRQRTDDRIREPSPAGEGGAAQAVTDEAF